MGFQSENYRRVSLALSSGAQDGRLDICLGGSIQLRNNVTELLLGLARALLQRNGISTGLVSLLPMTFSSM